MRVVIMEPGDPRVKIGERSIEEIRGALNGVETSMDTRHFGHDIVVITGANAETEGLSPNRVVEGKLMYGPMFVCRKGMTDLPILVAQDLRVTDVWPIVQLQAPDKPTVRGEYINTYYDTCPYCGAHLDPGEHCDCEKEEII